MRIRSLLSAALAASVLLGVLAVLAVRTAAIEEAAATGIQSRAQATAHEVASLLVLTQEYARDPDDRAAEQWHKTHAAIVEALAGANALPFEGSMLTELHAIAGALPQLFEPLVELRLKDDEFSQRRKEVVLDQLLSSTQTLSDTTHQWYLGAAEARRVADERHDAISTFVPIAMLLTMLALAWLIRQRVLLPLVALNDASAALGIGDLTVRVRSTARDELGDLARRFDATTAALEESAERLGRSERQLRAVTDNLPALVAYIDKDEVYRFTNAYYKTMSGMEPASFLGTTLEDSVGSTVYSSLKDVVGRALQGERQTFESHGLFASPDVHFLIEYIPDQDEWGTVNGFYVMAADITARKNAELALSRSERLLRLIADNLPSLIAYIDHDERFQFVNAFSRQLLGVEPSALLGKTVTEGLGETVHSETGTYLKAALSGTRQQFERVSVRDGRRTHLLAEYIPDLADDGTVVGLFAMAVDVTKLKEAQLMHARDEARLRMITDNLPVLISYIDRDETLRFANGTYRTWLGLNPEAIVDHPVADAVGSELYEPRRPYIRRALAGERVEFINEATTLGVARITNTTYIPDFDESGAIQGVYALSTDVTALKAIERQLQALARFDALTGMPNRLQFNEKLPDALNRTQRTGEAMALMFLDIDHFKSINDTLGHGAGDIVLTEFAKRLNQGVRRTDTVARLAGDEFVVILEGLRSKAEAELVAEKILAEVSGPFTAEGHSFAVTTSIGISYQDASMPSVTSAELLEKADGALYCAKAAGRNTYRSA